MNKAAILFIIASFFAATNNAYAFDGKRKGFQLGLGIGAHETELTYNNGFAPASIEAEQKVAVSLLVGYGFSNRITGFIGGKGGTILINDREASLAIGGIGASLHLTEVSPSLYLTGLVGTATLAVDGELEEHHDSGDGWVAGIGYELAEHLHLELSHARADLTDPRNTADTTTVESSFLTLNYIWY